MKNKLISIVLTLSIIFAIVIPFSITGFADDGDDAGTYKFTSDTKTLEIFDDTQMIDYSENESVNVPWNHYKANIEKIIIHDGVTQIGSYDFAKLDNLNEIVIPDSVTKIGRASIAGCSNLKTITISDNVVEIGENAFGYDNKMMITEGFVCNCNAGSFAQDYCFKNYIPFNASIPDNNTGNVVVEKTGGIMTMWSIVPKTDCKVTFYSTGGYDTTGFVFDADNYTYSSTYNIMKASAIAFNDDGGENLNFSITIDLTAGKRYYLATRFSVPSKLGRYSVNFDVECINHDYKFVGFDYDLFGSMKNILVEECSVCGIQAETVFEDIIKNQDLKYDVNNDSVVNAKDYAMINRGEY